MENKNKKQLIDFEKRIEKLWEDKKIPTPIHLSGGNEDQLIKIFKKINEDDYVFSTHRSYYHYLLKGGKEEVLEQKILSGESMSVIDKSLKFYSSSIVAGTPAIATGVAWALDRKGVKNRVYCFIGDAAAMDEGHSYEAIKYSCCNDLPITFVIEDNDRSVKTSIEDRWNSKKEYLIKDRKHILHYKYKPTWPHVGNGHHIQFT